MNERDTVDTVEAAKKLIRDIPESIWDAHVWNATGYTAGSLDPADRVRIAAVILRVIQSRAGDTSEERHPGVTLTPDERPGIEATVAERIKCFSYATPDVAARYVVDSIFGKWWLR